MGYAKFLKWVGEQALKNKVLQPYLNKAWREAEKLGRPIIEKNFPGILKKAQDFYKNFKTFGPKIVKPKVIKKDKSRIKEIMDDIGDIEDPAGSAPKIVPKIVKPIKVPEKTANILNIKSTLKGRPVKIIKDKKTGKIYEEKVVGPGAKIIYGKFPKKPPGKADGGSIDKALPGRSRDI